MSFWPPQLLLLLWNWGREKSHSTCSSQQHPEILPRAPTSKSLLALGLPASICGVWTHVLENRKPMDFLFNLWLIFPFLGNTWSHREFWEQRHRVPKGDDWVFHCRGTQEAHHLCLPPSPLSDISIPFTGTVIPSEMILPLHPAAEPTTSQPSHDVFPCKLSKQLAFPSSLHHPRIF